MTEKSKSIVSPGVRSALVVEGGGLRGAYCVGVLRMLHDYGGASQFNSIYAVSSGVFSATYFAAGQVDKMENTWRDLVHGSQLVGFFKPLLGRQILDLDYLIELFKGKVKLDLNRVATSKPSITYIVTDSETGEAKYVDAKSDAIFDYMRASSALPCVYSKPVIVNGRRYEDGGHSDPIPVKRAIEDGHEEIVVILTQPRGFIKRPRSRWVARACLGRSPAVMRAFLDSHTIYNESLRVIDNQNNGLTKIIAVRPKYMNISRLTRDREKIIGTIEQGKRDAVEVFDGVLEGGDCTNLK